MSLNLCLQISLYFPPKMNVLATALQLIFQMLIYNQTIYLFSNICIFRSLYTKYTSISISVHVSDVYVYTDVSTEKQGVIAID